MHRSAGTSTGNAPFILKVDPQNGGSRHLVMFTEELPPGRSAEKLGREAACSSLQTRGFRPR